MKKFNGPCKDCQKRYLNCHDTCTEYKDAKAAYENLKIKERSVIDDYCHERYQKFKHVNGK